MKFITKITVFAVSNLINFNSIYSIKYNAITKIIVSFDQKVQVALGFDQSANRIRFRRIRF